MKIQSRNQGIMIILITIVVCVFVYLILNELIGESRLLNAMVCLVPLVVSYWVRFSLPK